MMAEKRCSNCRYYDKPEWMVQGNGLCRRRDPHPEYGFPVIDESPGSCWCGEWMPTNEPDVFAVAPRDSFLDVFKAWSEYAEGCYDRGEEPIPLESFRRMESEWDT